MLILSRKEGESIKIGDDITVTILGMQGRQIRIGVEAPKNIPVHRQEIYEKIRMEKGTSANLVTNLVIRDGEDDGNK